MIDTIVMNELKQTPKKLLSWKFYEHLRAVAFKDTSERMDAGTNIGHYKISVMELFCANGWQFIAYNR